MTAVDLSELPAAASFVSLPSSFRDPAGFVFHHQGEVFRRVTPLGRDDYDLLMSSGLYKELTGADLLIAHEEVSSEALTALFGAENGLCLRPEQVPFISYPYEWCFSQLKEAALATLEIQRRALEQGLWLKDASAYNIQFVGGKPLLIDTTSFTHYREGEPWPAYRQFCEHFLAPLALMSYADVRCSQLLRIYIDGIPLSLAVPLMPFKTRLKPGLLTHLHLHAAAQRRHSDDGGSSNKAAAGRLPRTALLGLLDNLRGTVAGLEWQPVGTEWADYYTNTNYSADAMTQKQQMVERFLEAVQPAPRNVWDMGANDGSFSRLASRKGIPTVAWDVDPSAVEKCWRAPRQANEAHLLPLVQDLTNPSPDLGWAGRERDSLMRRGPADVVLMLAVLHHLTITRNIPFPLLSAFLSEICGRDLIIEWVPEEDSQAERLLAHRDGPVIGYTREAFETAFSRDFEIVASEAIPQTVRRLYRMRRRTAAPPS